MVKVINNHVYVQSVLILKDKKIVPALLMPLGMGGDTIFSDDWTDQLISMQNMKNITATLV